MDQHHLMEFYLTMAKTALGIFQAITYSLGVTYKFIEEFIVVVGGAISYIR